MSVYFILAKIQHQSNPTDESATAIHYHRKAMDIAANGIILIQMYNETDYDFDELLLWIDNLQSVSSEIWVAKELIGKGEGNAAIQKLDNISFKYQLSDEDLTSISDVKELSNLIIDQSIYDLVPNILTNINNYSHLENRAGEWAKNILTYYGEHFPPQYRTSTTLDGLEVQDNNEIELNDRKKSIDLSNKEYIKVYPNPASNQVQFHINQPFMGDANLVVKDSQGKEIYHLSIGNGEQTFTWDTQNFTSGIYFYELFTEKEYLNIGKLILSK